MSFDTEEHNRAIELIRQLDGFSKDYALSVLTNAIYIVQVLNSPICMKRLEKAWWLKEKEDKKNTP